MSFGATKVEREGAKWVMEFFDARTKWFFVEFAEELRTVGVPLPEVPDPPESGFVVVTEWKGTDVAVGYSDERGCHLVSSKREVLEELSDLTDELP